MNIHQPSKWSAIAKAMPRVKRTKRPDEFKSVAEYNTYYDSVLAKDLEQMKALKIVVACPYVTMEVQEQNGLKIPYRNPRHPEAQPTYACRHCTEQDPVNPVGVAVMPGKWYLCLDCYRLANEGKFDYPTEIIMVCHPCIGDFLKKLLTSHPDKLKML